MGASHRSEAQQVPPSGTKTPEVRAPRDADKAAHALCLRLGHTFRDEALRAAALTHRSFLHEHPGRTPGDNERLEFLGDAVFGAAAAMLLHAQFPAAREGELTRRRADLVNERALAEIAVSIGLGEALQLGKGEERSGGRSKPRLLASALEACIAAVFLDAGVERAIEVARSLLAPRLDVTRPGERDFKSRLQERLQSGGTATPRYELERTEGPEHARTFHVTVRDGLGAIIAAGSGRTKLDAEQTAACEALRALGDVPG